MKAVNPATEEARDVEETPLGDIPAMVEAAAQAQKPWGSLPVESRVSALRKLIPLLKGNRQALARTITEDMGKPLKASASEIDSSIEEIRYFHDHAAAWLAPERTEGGSVRFDPLGVVAVISPWNYPIFVPLVQSVPPLLAGNAVVFKPSEHALLTGIELGKLFQELDVPLLTLVGGKDHGKVLVWQDVAAVSFTGSTRAGKDIMRSSADKLHKIILELGGLDAAIVLKDAPLPETAKEIVRGNCRNSGQVCCAIKRVFVERPLYQEFVKAAVEESRKVTFGDPTKSPDMGPLVARFQLEKVLSILEDAKRKGAEVLTGGSRPEGKGFCFPSTVLTNLTPDMRVLSEEPFGPLLPIVPVDSWEEAVELSNATRYGLTGSIWAQDTALAKKIASRLEVGVVNINAYGSGPPGAPWGGAKESGLGRTETKEGLREFTNIKYVRSG